MRRKSVTLGVLIIVILFSAAVVFAGGEQEGSAEAENPYVMGVTFMSMRHPFFQSMQEGMEEAAEEKGIILRCVDADFDLGKQSNQIKDFIQQKVDAIIVTPLDAKALNPSVNAAVDAGIPVVCVDTDAVGSKRLTKVASDNVLGGKIAGSLMTRKLNDLSISSGIVLIVDHTGVTSTQERNKGFRETMSEQLPNIKIEVMDAVGQRDKAMNVTEDAIQRFGEQLVGVFGVNDDCSLGALSAVERMGKIDQVSVVGYDAGDESKAAIKAGKIVGNTIQFPGRMGVKGMQVALDYLNNVQTEFPDFIPVEVGAYIQSGVVDKEEVLIK